MSLMEINYSYALKTTESIPENVHYCHKNKERRSFPIICVVIVIDKFIQFQQPV